VLAIACRCIRIGDSIDFIYGNSSTRYASQFADTLGGGLGINGKGEVFGFRYNHIFPRAGEYTPSWCSATTTST
jgi:hypothetical protein